MDDTDRKILDLLQTDSRITNVELARRVGLAPATTLERVKKLEQRGLIRATVALVDAKQAGYGTTAFVSVILASHDAATVRAFRDAVQTLPQVLECYHITGELDYLLKVIARDIEAYEAFLLDELAQVPGFGRIRTSFVLSTVKHATQIPVWPGEEKD